MQKLADNPSAGERLCWDDVHYFLELARCGSLSAAARSLAVEHSTVARRVAALEARIGIRLFDRLPRSWALTREGEDLLPHAQRIEEEAHAFSRATMSVSALSGTVRLSAPPVLASHFIVPRMGWLRRRWPGITLDIVGEAREADLYRREADLALRLSRPAAGGLAARPLASLGYGLYAAKSWVRRPQQEWAFVGYGAGLRDTPQQQWLEKLAGTRPFALYANDLAALYQACRTGFGIAALPHFLARDDKALVLVPDHECPVSRSIWLVVHPDVRRSPRVKAVAEGLAELLHEHGSLLA